MPTPHPGTSWEDLHTMTWDDLVFLIVGPYFLSLSAKSPTPFP